MDGGAWWATFYGSQRVGHGLAKQHTQHRVKLWFQRPVVPFGLNSVWASESKRLRRWGWGWRAGGLFSRSSSIAATFSTIVEAGGGQVGKIRGWVIHLELLQISSIHWPVGSSQAQLSPAVLQSLHHSARTPLHLLMPGSRCHPW